MASPSVTVRLPDDVNIRLMKAIDKLGCTKTEFVLTAIELQLEAEEAKHVPAVIRAAMPRRSGALMSMPEGIVHNTDW
jgi:hypothetical protein